MINKSRALCPRAQIRKDLFKATRHDINMSLTSAKDASAWEKVLNRIAHFGKDFCFVQLAAFRS